ncbi:MAG: hypothetical protein ACKOYH_04375 [Cyanobium sp.]
MTNGSFEADVIPDNTFRFGYVLSGWRLGYEGIDIIRKSFYGFSAQDGSQFVELDTYANTPIFQTISSFTIGQSYNFSFYYSPRADSSSEKNLPASTLGLDVYLGPSKIFSIAQDGGPTMNWQKIVINSLQPLPPKPSAFKVQEPQMLSVLFSTMLL